MPIHSIDAFNPPGGHGDFYANTLIRHFSQFRFIIPPHKHDFYFVVICTSGTGIHTIDFTDYPFKKGDMFMLTPGQSHSWQVSANTDGYILFHTRDFYEANFSQRKLRDFSFLRSTRYSPAISTNTESFEKICSLFRDVIVEYEHMDEMRHEKLCALVDILYITLSRLCKPTKEAVVKNQHYLNKLDILEDLVEAHFRHIKSAGEYAALMHMSEKHLNRICKASINKTTSTVIIERIILEAKRLLAGSGFSVAEVARELGYSDSAYFSRLFKKKCGVSPAGFTEKRLA